MLLVLALALAADPPPPPEAVVLGDEEVDETVLVTGELEVKKARDELTLKLRSEGYKRAERHGDYTVYKSEIAYHPQVWLHDDGWVSLRRQPPRIHSPGHAFADQGSPLIYLWCVPTLMTACVSVGGWMIGPRKYTGIKGDLLDSTRTEVRKVNDAVVRQHLGQRLYKDIPGDLDKLWRDAGVAAEVRRRLIFVYWDSRVENDAGYAAKKAIQSFILGVVQASPEPYTAAELASLNADRTSERPLVLAGLEAPAPSPAPTL